MRALSDILSEEGVPLEIIYKNSDSKKVQNDFYAKDMGWLIPETKERLENFEQFLKKGPKIQEINQYFDDKKVISNFLTLKYLVSYVFGDLYFANLKTDGLIFCFFFVFLFCFFFKAIKSQNHKIKIHTHVNR